MSPVRPIKFDLDDIPEKVAERKPTEFDEAVEAAAASGKAVKFTHKFSAAELADATLFTKAANNLAAAIRNAARSMSDNNLIPANKTARVRIEQPESTGEALVKFWISDRNKARNAETVENGDNGETGTETVAVAEPEKEVPATKKK